MLACQFSNSVPNSLLDTCLELLENFSWNSDLRSFNIIAIQCGIVSLIFNRPSKRYQIIKFSTTATCQQY